MKALKGVVTNMQEQLASLKKKHEAASRAIETLQRRGNPGGSSSGIVCHLCGEKGHIARDCPNKEKKGKSEGEEE